MLATIIVYTLAPLGDCVLKFLCKINSPSFRFITLILLYLSLPSHLIKPNAAHK